MYNDWLSNIAESVKANVNFKELVDVRNGVKWYDMQNIMCIITII